MRTALYARVSTDRQETANQMEALRTFCVAAGHEIVAEFVDDGITGSGRKRRPAFEQMMADARQRKFDLLLFWALDRLSREGALATLQHLTKLDSFGVQWRSHTEAFLDSTGPLKDAVIAIFGCMAKQERIQLSERTKAGMARAKAQGKNIGRQLDFDAYRRVGALAATQPGLSVRALGRGAGVSAETVRRALRLGVSHMTAYRIPA